MPLFVPVPVSYFSVMEKDLGYYCQNLMYTGIIYKPKYRHSKFSCSGPQYLFWCYLRGVLHSPAQDCEVPFHTLLTMLIVLTAVRNTLTQLLSYIIWSYFPQFCYAMTTFVQSLSPGQQYTCTVLTIKTLILSYFVCFPAGSVNGSCMSFQEGALAEVV